MSYIAWMKPSFIWILHVKKIKKKIFFFIKFIFKGNYTYETRGANRIVANTAGCEKTRLSLAFGASAKGSKLPLVVLIPRKKPLKDFEPPSNVIVVYKKSASFDATTVKNGFVQRSLLPTIILVTKKLN